VQRVPIAYLPPRLAQAHPWRGLPAIRWAFVLRVCTALIVAPIMVATSARAETYHLVAAQPFGALFVDTDSTGEPTPDDRLG
jgi:hypothetical protein